MNSFFLQTLIDADSSLMKERSELNSASFWLSRWSKRLLYTNQILWMIDSLVALMISVQSQKCFRRSMIYFTCCHFQFLHLRIFIFSFVRLIWSIHTESSDHSFHACFNITYMKFHLVLTFCIISCEFKCCRLLNNSRHCEETLIAIVMIWICQTWS